ncbi:MAG: hypothetical protein PHN84_10890 [Desulfuromonadaceae bacterium]|nr:hypothetical protein [Desulfuromonadaceae bacterium]MDD2856731.1 hypothetical protein [Desulfuromonadaceae bacterium]
MAKNTQKNVSEIQQMSLFDLLSRDRAERAEIAPGKMCISARLMTAVKLAVKQAPKSRETLCDEMSLLAGAEITINMLSSWCADSHPHRLPAEYLPALCAATGSTEPMRIMAEASGLFALPGPDALRADMQRDVEQKREIDKRIRQKEALIKALEVEK